MVTAELNVQLLWVILSVIIGTLAAIVYSLRILVLMERRMARIEAHLEGMSKRILKEEVRIEKRIVRKKPARKKKK